MFRRKPVLPDVPIYGFIGGIPETFGGRTAVCLQRAHAFAELGHRKMEILTLSPAHGIEPEVLTARLRREGRIGENVTIRNIWADLRRAGDAELIQIVAHSSKPASIDASELLPFDGSLDSEKRSTADKVLQVDRFRSDGTRLISYRLPAKIDDRRIPRRVVLFDRTGSPIGQWEQQYRLYFAWLDWVIGTEPAVLINDGPLLARYMYRYRRDNVVFVQTIHSRHSSAPGSPTGVLAATYLPTFMAMEQFDRVAVLSRAQQNDIMGQQLAVDNLRVLPNMMVAQRARRFAPRDRMAGVMLARSTFQKRIDHAINAVCLAQRVGTGARLDIYGVADEAEDSLHDLIEASGVKDTIALKGFDPRAKERFAQASFTMLTSRFEGQSLSLLEAMAAGCIPIAYDIKYGTSDIITDGVNGFLVPSGDVEALSEKIVEFARLSEHQVRKMRKAATERALQHTPEAITRRWGEMLTEALATKPAVLDVKGRATVASVEVDNDAIVLRVKVSGDAAKDPEWARLTWIRRQGVSFGRVPATIHGKGKFVIVEATVSFADFVAVPAGPVDFWVDLRVAGNPVRLRVKGAGEGLPVQHERFELYATKYQGLSVTVAPDNNNRSSS